MKYEHCDGHRNNQCPHCCSPVQPDTAAPLLSSVAQCAIHPTESNAADRLYGPQGLSADAWVPPVVRAHEPPFVATL